MEKYQQLSVVGEGSYGLVLKCKHKETDQVVAIKKFLETEEDAGVRKVALREIRMLKRLRHENLVTLIEVFRHRKRFYLVFEHLEGSLLDELEKKTGGLNETICRDRIYQVTRAVHFCHMNNVIHRDIKPENVLVSSLGVVKLCDFGFARLVSIAGECCTEYVATRWYRAPELLIGDANYGAPVDIWAIGCLYAEMRTGDPLLPGDSDIDQLYLTMKLLGRPCLKHEQVMIKNSQLCGIIKSAPDEGGLHKMFSHWSSTSLDFITCCLKMDPQCRPTSEQLLKHKLFTHDNFSTQFLPQLRQKVAMEFSENPLLRHLRDQVLSSTDRLIRREEMGKARRSSDMEIPPQVQPQKWQIKIGEAVKRKLSQDTINSYENISSSDRNLNISKTNQKKSLQSVQALPKETSLQSMIKDKVNQEFSAAQKLSSGAVLSSTKQKRRSDMEAIQKTISNVTKLNQKSDTMIQIVSAHKEELEAAISPAHFQSLQSNIPEFKSPSRTSISSQNILHPSISNICFCKEPYKKQQSSTTILQAIQNTSIRNTFNQLPIANPPTTTKYIKKTDKGLYCEPPFTMPDLNQQNNTFDLNLNNSLGIKIKKKEKPEKRKQYENLCLPNCPGATGSPNKPNKKPQTSPEELITQGITPRTKSSISQKSTNSHYLAMMQDIEKPNENMTFWTFVDSLKSVSRQG